MNLTIARALLEDARQQVLDNKVFRLLLVVSLVPVAFTFLIGFHEDAISVMWGWEEIEYQKIFEAFGNVLPRDISPREVMIQGLLSFLIENLAGTLGVIVSIAATAFFVPRMMEKGAADTLFSKPVSRLTLLLSRYFAGLLFIAALAAFLVVGMYLGLLLNSGYNDPGMLWGIVTLVYLFALVHAFSISIATLTRSSTAAILLSILLFMFGGCLHDAWIIKEHAQETELIEKIRAQSEVIAAVPGDDEGAEGARQLADTAKAVEEKPSWLRMLVLALDSVHYVLPKTSDADIITSQLRRAVSGSGPVLEDPEGDLVVERDPDGYELVRSTAGDITGAGVRWVKAEGGEAQGLLVLRRSDRAYEDVAPDGRTRERRVSPNAAARELEEAIEQRPGVSDVARGREYVSGRQAASVRWIEAADGARTVNEHMWFGFADWLFELEMRWPEGSVDEEDHSAWRNEFLANMKLGRAEFQQPGEWYRDQFGWTAPLRFNAFFSIGTSLAFAAAMIAIAWIRLKLTDFDMDAGLARALERIVGERGVVVDRTRRSVYECDALAFQRRAPDLVVLPRDTAETAACMRLLHEADVPVVPRGAGTGLAGGATPVEGGAVVSTARMRRVLELSVEDRFARIEAGLVNVDLTRACSKHGLYYAPDPSSQRACTVGGNVANNSGGPHCFKYGNTTRHVLGLVVVTPEGEVLDLSEPELDPAGLDLVGSFVGSEGMFGVATELTVRLLPVPEVTETILALFTSLDAACDAVSDAIARRLEPSAMEILDKLTIRAVEDSVYAAGYPREAEAVLLIEVDGPELEVEENARDLEEIARAHGAIELRRARDAGERARLWAGRKGAFGAMGRIAPDLYVADVVVPRTRLRELVAHAVGVCAARDLKLANVFHAGDGNLHPNISYDRRDPDELRRVLDAGLEIMKATIAAGGTLSGEHGIGLEKRAEMALYFTPADLDAMLAVRAAWDPAGRMNPGKVVPQRACMEIRTAPPAPA